MKFIIFMLVLFLLGTIEMIILLYRAYLKIRNRLEQVNKIIESHKVISSHELTKEEFEHNDTLRIIQDEINGITLEEACK